MASSFSSRNDNVLRVGDYVRTITASEAQQRRLAATQQNASTSALRPPSRLSASRASQRTSHPRIGRKQDGLSLPPAQSMSGSSPMELSATAQLFNADTSSLGNWWTSMTQGTWLQEKEEAVRIGVVHAVGHPLHGGTPSGGTAEIVVWMRGEECLVECPKKPIETFRLDRLEKLTPIDFNERCRKKFMHEMSHHLKLRGEGYDESAPFALIAHNNRVISDLIGKIDTTAKLSLKDVKTRRPRGPADLLKGPIPTMVPVEDPLAMARGELQALQATGLVQSRRKHTANMSIKQSDDHIVHGASRCVSATLLMAGGGERRHNLSNSSSNTAAGGGGQQQSLAEGGPRNSFLEDAMYAETMGVQRDIRVASAPLTQPARLRSKVPVVPDRFFPTSLSPVDGNHVSRSFVSDVDMESMEASKGIMCTLIDSLPDGKLLLRPSRSSDPPFVATLAFVSMWRHPSTSAALSALFSTELRVIPRRRDFQGSCVCDVRVSNECLAESLLSEGYATLNVSAIDQPSTLLSAAAAFALQAPSQTVDRLQALKRAQDKAIAEQRGVWGGSNAGGAPPLVDLPDMLEPSEDEHLPALFQAFEASRYFNQKLTEKLS